MNNVIRIGVVGPESTGKSTLCAHLARYFKTSWVPEYSREYLNNLSKPYDLTDIIQINYGQLKLENDLLKEGDGFLFCDTTPLVNKIWCEFKYNSCPPEIENSFIDTYYDLHLLCYIDVPWQEDPLREHKHKRKELFDLYFQTLTKYKKPFAIVKGLGEERFKNAIKILKENFPSIFSERKFE